MLAESPLLEEQLELERRSLAIQMAVLEKKGFIAGALVALQAELGGAEGKSWKQVKAEQKIGV